MNLATADDTSKSQAPDGEAIDETRSAWHDLAALELDERGMIRGCSRASEKLLGYHKRDLVWQPISRLLPQLSGIALLHQGRINPLLDYLCHCGRLFKAINRQGDAIPTELSMVHLEHKGNTALRLILRPCSLPGSTTAG